MFCEHGSDIVEALEDTSAAISYDLRMLRDARLDLVGGEDLEKSNRLLDGICSGLVEYTIRACLFA